MSDSYPATREEALERVGEIVSEGENSLGYSSWNGLWQSLEADLDRGVHPNEVHDEATDLRDKIDDARGQIEKLIELLERWPEEEDEDDDDDE